MNNVRLFLDVLWHIQSIGNSINEEFFGLDSENFARILIDMQNEGLLKGVEVTSEDDKVLDLNIENIEITSNGIEFLKQMDDEIQKNILEVLYENKLENNLTNHKIRKRIFTHIKHSEMEAHLNILKDMDLVKEEKKRIPASKGPWGNTEASTHIKYRISHRGIELVESGFKKKERENVPKTVWNISGGIVNFGTIQNLNYIEELKAIIPQPDVREEIEQYFGEIKTITAEENVSKSKLATIFNKICDKLAEKGMDKIAGKVIETGWMLVMTQMMQIIK